MRWLAGDEPKDVVDLGAGTGKLTRALVALGHRVTAIEPLPQMLELLPEAAPGAFAILGNAEVIPLPDAHADVVTCAQSFHWFDHPVALPEIARVLRPGGRLALVWNTRDDEEPWVARLSAIIGNEAVSDDGCRRPDRRERPVRAGRERDIPLRAARRPRAPARPRPLAELLRKAASRRA